MTIKQAQEWSENNLTFIARYSVGLEHDRRATFNRRLVSERVTFARQSSPRPIEMRKTYLSVPMSTTG
jgi:hypothetical protein